MLNIERMLNPLRGFLYEAQGTGGGGSVNQSSTGGGFDRDKDRDPQGTTEDAAETVSGSDAPSVSELESAFEGFGQDSTVSDFSIGGETASEGFQREVGDVFGSGIDRGFSSVSMGSTFSEGFARGIGDEAGTFSQGFTDVADIRTFGEKLDDFFGYEVPKFFDNLAAAPLDTVAEVLRHPVGATVAGLTGLGPIAAGIAGLDAAVDVFQGEQTPTEAAKMALSAAISSPLGASLGPLQGVAAQAAADPTQAGKIAAGFVGGQAGTRLGAEIGSLAGNPFGTAIGATLGGIAGSRGAKRLAETSASGTSEPAVQGEREQGRRADRSSPLVQDKVQADATKLARKVRVDKFLPEEIEQQQKFNPYVGEIYRG